MECEDSRTMWYKTVMWAIMGCGRSPASSAVFPDGSGRKTNTTAVCDNQRITFIDSRNVASR